MLAGDLSKKLTDGVESMDFKVRETATAETP
jgi:hypothetical protein